MRYVSTRGQAPALGFSDALLAGLASDGGLYVPEQWPVLPAVAPGEPYPRVAAGVLYRRREGIMAKRVTMSEPYEIAGNGLLHRRALLGQGMLIAGAAATRAAGPARA